VPVFVQFGVGNDSVLDNSAHRHNYAHRKGTQAADKVHHENESEIHHSVNQSAACKHFSHERVPCIGFGRLLTVATKRGMSFQQAVRTWLVSTLIWKLFHQSECSVSFCQLR